MEVIRMAISMTGYGMGSLNTMDTTVTVEIRSVNHRFLDVTVKMPHAFLFLEVTIKKMIQSYFKRGKIEVYIGVEGDGLVQKKLTTDWELMDHYMHQMNLAMDRYQLKGEIPPTMITAMPEIISVQETSHKPEGLKTSIIKTTQSACEQLKTMRRDEGSFLGEDIIKRIAIIYDIVKVLEKLRPQVQAEYRERIQARINEFISGQEIMDHTRFYQEMILLAEKGDITEEITRLYSHMEQMKELVGQPEAMGRKLDFISQEMHREANTIGSKSTDPKVSVQAVALKSEIEKIKEQIQNIE
jgi:uncharacterized protein (TIGR00255 family)